MAVIDKKGHILLSPITSIRPQNDAHLAIQVYHGDQTIHLFADGGGYHEVYDGAALSALIRALDMALALLGSPQEEET